jgi:hypothetical protein
MLFFLFISPTFLYLLSSSSTAPHTQLNTHTQRQKKERKNKTERRIKRAQKPQIKTQDKKTKRS